MSVHLPLHKEMKKMQDGDFLSFIYIESVREGKGSDVYDVYDCLYIHGELFGFVFALYL